MKTNREKDKARLLDALAPYKDGLISRKELAALEKLYLEQYSHEKSTSGL